MCTQNAFFILPHLSKPLAKQLINSCIFPLVYYFAYVNIKNLMSLFKLYYTQMADDFHVIKPSLFNISLSLVSEQIQSY